MKDDDLENVRIAQAFPDTTPFGRQYWQPVEGAARANGSAGQEQFHGEAHAPANWAQIVRHCPRQSTFA